MRPPPRCSEVITQRYLKSSTVLTTNLGIGSWGKIFDDPMVAAAMLDRSVVFNIDGESYRMRTHRARAERLTKAVTSNPNAYPSASPHPGEHLGNLGDREWGISAIADTADAALAHSHERPHRVLVGVDRVVVGAEIECSRVRACADCARDHIRAGMLKVSPGPARAIKLVRAQVTNTPVIRVSLCPWRRRSRCPDRPAGGAKHVVGTGRGRRDPVGAYRCELDVKHRARA